MRLPFFLLLVAAWLAPFAPLRAQTGDVLGECVALSGVDDDIHACLDNYLDVMDDNLRDITEFIRREFSGPSRAAFERSQAAFESFRRENCLWYLAFSTPRAQAEQIAKNCLARMSLDRLSELQGLLANGDGSSRRVEGFYVYGANRNSFRPCGSDARYWVEGNQPAVSSLQQSYLEAASVDLQVMFASVTGVVDEAAQTAADHDGVLRISAVNSLRVPSEADCRLPNGSPPVTSVAASDAAPAQSVEERVAEAPVVVSPVAAANAPGDAPEVARGPEQHLTAYFGAWLADCIEDGSQRRCRLAVDMSGPSGDGGAPASLSLIRRGESLTTVEVRFPGREIDSTAKIRWGVDGYEFGDILGSEIRVDAEATRQLVAERRFVRDDLLPLMKEGTDLSVEVVAEADDTSGDRYEATLLGLTRAIDFADSFVLEGGGL